MHLTIVKTRSKGEQTLIMATRPRDLAGLDEDALLDLHHRVRRGRNKYAKLYRRGASGQVSKDSARGRASATHRRDADRAEVFEDALARVSRALARAARASADASRWRPRAAPRAAGHPARGKVSSGGPTRARSQTPAGKKHNTSTRAAQARGQARRDAR
jgi:hypothetical protein